MTRTRPPSTAVLRARGRSVGGGDAIRSVGCFRLALAASVALVVVPARAEGPADRRILAAVERAQARLAELDVEGAAELLAAAARETDGASSPARARLMVTVGWARSELGDPEGAREAFDAAVARDLAVQLPPQTSPKIRAALERAREAARSPPDDRGPGPKAAPPTAPSPGVDPELRSKTEPQPRAETGPGERPEADSSARSKGAPDARTGAGAGPGTKTGAEPPPRSRAPTASSPAAPGGPPPRGSIKARPSLPEPPSLAEAWSEPAARRMPGSTTVDPPGGSTAGVQTSTATAADRRPMTTWGPGLTEKAIWGLAIGAVAVAAGVAALVVVLSEGSSCGAPEGFGCTRVRIEPLVRF